MNYLAFICPDDTSAPDEEMIFGSKAPRWVKEMERRGVRLFGRELEAPSSASTVRVRNNETLVTDGPCVETRGYESRGSGALGRRQT
ncbi:hypothetical protein [Ferrimicrobium sp.]|uniref:hypothetical protein n=1 Tax=Ferrimicrobium sp. TaxID=2926050 RepID=UPI002608D811|nr:hypothetical protein [Ferrimicrobium sp.]